MKATDGDADRPEVDLVSVSAGVGSGIGDDEGYPSDAIPEEISTEVRRMAKQGLLDAIEFLDRGYAASEDDKKLIKEKIGALSGLGPLEEPTSELGGEWTLMYTDAPDILNIPSGPFASIGRIGQEIDPVARTITNVIEYVPSSLAAGIAEMASQDALVQRVITEYSIASATKVDLRISGIGFQPRRVFGFELPDFAKFQAKGPLSLPFGQFEILYMDDEIRIVRTYQGYYSVNRRAKALSP